MSATLPLALLERLRAGGEAAADARARLAVGAPHSAALRSAVTTALASDLRPSDRSLARWLLETETAAQVARGRNAETLYTLVAALARFGQASDALALWRAREATTETRVGVDAEQFARAGLSATRVYLAAAADDGAAAALAWLDEQAASGAFVDLTAYFAWSDERYGIHISGPT